MTDSTRIYGGRTVADRQAERRQRFLEAALEEFSGTGYARSSVTSLCKAAGLSRRQFYEIFDDREALLIAVYDEIQGSARDAVSAALAACESSDHHELATTAMRAYMEAIATDPRRAEVSFVQVVGVSPTMEAHRLAGRDEWMDFFVTGLSTFARREPSPRTHQLATAFVGALTAVVHGWSIEQKCTDIDEVVSVLSDILVAFITL